MYWKEGDGWASGWAEGREAACGSRERVRALKSLRPSDLGIGTRSCRLRSISQIRTVAPKVCEFEYKQTPPMGMEYPGSDHRAGVQKAFTLCQPIAFTWVASVASPG